MADRFLVVISATPKTGELWLTHTLSNVFTTDIVSGFIHNWDDFSKDAFSTQSGVLINCRNPPDDKCLSRIRNLGFQSITVVRHPFDVLINLLLTASSDAESFTYWINNFNRIDMRLIDSIPRHPMLTQYAVSQRAQELFSISSAWWKEKDTIGFRFEDLAEDPAKELGPILSRYQSLIHVPLQEALDRQNSSKVGRPEINKNMLSGRMAGIWRHLIPAKQAHWLAVHLHALMQELDYSCDPDLSLDAEQADLNWFFLKTAESIRPLSQSLMTYRAQKEAIGEGVGRQLDELQQHINCLQDLLSRPMVDGSYPTNEVSYLNKEIVKFSNVIK